MTPGELRWRRCAGRRPTHLIVQTFDDDPARPINMHERQALLTAEEYRAMIERLRAEIGG